MKNVVERELMKCGGGEAKEVSTPALERVEGVSASALGREGAGGADGKPTPPPRYSAANVVLADVDHLRAYRGETDELLYRMRTVEAEDEFMRLLDGGMEPDWFVERWDAERKVLVACLVFESEEGADSLAKVLKGAVADGTAKCVRFRDDAGMKEEVAEYFSAEWWKAHEREMAKVGEAYADAVRGYGPRILVGWVEKEWFDNLSDIVNGSAGLVAHAAVVDDVLGRVNVCLGFKGTEHAAMLESTLCDALHVSRFSVPRADMEDEVPRQMVVAMAKRLAAHDAKAKAEKDNGKDVG